MGGGGGWGILAVQGLVKTRIADPYSNPDPDPPDPHVLGLLDPDPDPLIRCMDPYPDPSIIEQK